MKVLHVSYLDGSGGAHIAARRICEAQREYGIDATMLVNSKSSSKTFVREVSFKRKIYNMFANVTGQKVAGLQKKSSNLILHSLNIFPSKLYHLINSSDCDVVNLHWINAEFMRIEDLRKINKPIVWTLHDMWPFSGAEHYDDLEYPERYISGYTKSNRPKHYQGPDFDLTLFNRKKKCYPVQMHIVSPSNWMKGCAEKSCLFEHYTHAVIPNTLNNNIFKPVSKKYSRELLNLPMDKKLVLFGAFNSKDDPRKGFRFVREAIDLLNHQSLNDDIEFVIYGSEQRDAEVFGNIKAHFIGKFSDEIALSTIYNAVDVFVAPSMQDNLPNTVLEALACGTPTVAFDIGGISDLVKHGVTGFLTKPFDVTEFTNNIIEAIRQDFRADCVQYFQENFSKQLVAKKYLDFYNDAQ